MNAVRFDLIWFLHVKLKTKSNRTVWGKTKTKPNLYPLIFLQFAVFLVDFLFYVWFDSVLNTPISHCVSNEWMDPGSINKQIATSTIKQHKYGYCFLHLFYGFGNGRSEM